MSRLIDADALIKDFDKRCFGECCCCIESTNTESGCKVIDEQPTVDAVPVAYGKWIPFKMRKPDPDELEDHPDWTYVLDGQLPDEGQRILVSCVFKGHEAVQLDEFYTDADGCYLDSGYEIGTEVSAWMPLPEPYKMDEVTE